MIGVTNIGFTIILLLLFLILIEDNIFDNNQVFGNNFLKLQTNQLNSQLTVTLGTSILNFLYLSLTI